MILLGPCGKEELPDISDDISFGIFLDIQPDSGVNVCMLSLFLFTRKVYSHVIILNQERELLESLFRLLFVVRI